MGTLNNNVFKESGLIFTFPDNNCFLFSGVASYQNLSLYGFKEMDVCWFDVKNKLLYLIELKDFTNNNSKTKMNTRLAMCVEKTRSCLIMLNAVIDQTNFGKQFQNNLAHLNHIWQIFDNTWEIVVFSLVHTKANAAIYNNAFNLVISNAIQINQNNNQATIVPYKDLFKTKIKLAAVLDIDTAKNNLKGIGITLT